MSEPEKTYKKCQKLAESGQIDSLNSVLGHAINNFPQDSRFLNLRAKLALQQGNFKQAQSDLEKTVQLNPFDCEALDNLGVLEQRHGNYIRASELHIAALNHAPNDINILFNLAVALENLEQYTQAINLYEGILGLNPNHDKAMVNLAVHYDKAHKDKEAEALLKKALDLNAKNFEACMSLANFYRQREEKDKAKEYYQKALDIDPTHATAQFMLANISGETPQAPPEEYVANLFDDFAQDFEKKLVGKLDYRAPDLIYKAIKENLEKLKQKHNSLKAIDLGAGTGLFGQLIRPQITLSIGVDLSQKMLDKAQEKKIYDEIICDDLNAAMAQQAENSCHLISAADVFVYVGNLEKVFKQVSRLLHKEGLFVFSVESLDNDEDEDFKLLETARYAHQDGYIKKLAKKHDLKIIYDEKTWLRKNKGVEINGAIYCLAKASAHY